MNILPHRQVQTVKSNIIYIEELLVVWGFVVLCEDPFINFSFHLLQGWCRVEKLSRGGPIVDYIRAWSTI